MFRNGINVVVKPALACALAGMMIGCASSERAEQNGASEPAQRAGGAPDAGGEATLRSSEPLGGTGALVSVKGMSCPLCAHNIQKNVSSLTGVTDVKVDLSDGTVRVAFAPAGHPSGAQLAEAIESAGFTPTSIETVR